MPKDKITINENLQGKTVDELKKIQKRHGIKDDDIIGTGKNGNILKKDRVIAIFNAQAKKSKKPYISPKKTPPKAAKKTPKKKTPKKVKTPVKEKTPSPKKKKAKKVKTPVKEKTPKKKVKKVKTPVKEKSPSPVKVKTPKKKKVKKVKTPVKEKSPSPVKVKTPKKVKKVKKVKSPKKVHSDTPQKRSPKCIDKHVKKSLRHYKKCRPEKVCNTLTGNCVANTSKNTRGKDVLTIKTRQFVGEPEYIAALLKKVGGNVSHKKTIKTPVKHKRAPPPENIEKHIKEVVKKGKKRSKKKKSKTPKKNDAATFKIESKLKERKTPKKTRAPIKLVKKTFAEHLRDL